MKTPDITQFEFDHDADFIKRRTFGEGVTYEQDGVLFSSGFVALKVLRAKAKKDGFDDMNANELRALLRQNNIAPPQIAAKKKPAAGRKPQTNRQSAEDKLEGFKAPDGQSDHVKQALSENHSALSAEQQAD